MRAVLNVGNTPPQCSPACICWSAVSPVRSTGVVGSEAKGTAPATMPLSYRQLNPIHGPVFRGWYCRCVVWLNFSSWSMRKTPEGAEGVAPAPLTCGRKKRAETVEKTICAENPCRFGTLTRPANPGILDLSHAIGKKIGVFPRMLKSYALWVYFPMYSPENTRYFPTACCNPAWNSLRQPGLKGVELDEVQLSSGFKTGLSHPTLATIKFSLNGVSSTLA